MTESQETKITDNEQIKADKPWLFKKGVSGNKNGRPKKTEVEKIKDKATKQFIQEYKDNLAKALPKIEPVLVAKALEGDIMAIKEINSLIIGQIKPKDDTGDKILPQPIININFFKKDVIQSDNDNVD